MTRGMIYNYILYYTIVKCKRLYNRGRILSGITGAKVNFEHGVVVNSCSMKCIFWDVKWTFYLLAAPPTAKFISCQARPGLWVHYTPCRVQTVWADTYVFYKYLRPNSSFPFPLKLMNMEKKGMQSWLLSWLRDEVRFGSTPAKGPINRVYFEFGLSNDPATWYVDIVAVGV